MDDQRISPEPPSREPPGKRLTISRPPAGEGISWLKESWLLFRRSAIAWMGMSALAFLVIALAGTYLHRGLVEILSPFLVAGFMAAAHAAKTGQPVTFLALGAGFQRRAPALLGIGVLYYGGTLLVDFIVRQSGGVGVEAIVELAQQDPASLDPEATQALLNQALPGMLATLAMLLPMLLATWFAPALVLFDGFPTVRSLWWSLWTCLVNWRPMALYGLAVMPLAFLSVLLPFGLGFLVFMPLFMIATYLAYRAMFVEVA